MITEAKIIEALEKYDQLNKKHGPLSENTPEFYGGVTELENLKLACRRCNCKKSNRIKD